VDGADCPAIDCLPPEEIKACEPLRDCQGDAQCAQGFVCHSETYQNCTMADVACDPDGTCTKEVPSTCEAVTETSCVPRWVLPCTTADDCGGGFNCVEQQECWCSGSMGTAGGAEPSGTAGASAGDGLGLMDPLPDMDAGVAIAEPTCGCSPSGTFSCELQDLPCESDADCSDGFTCQEDVYSSGCAVASDVDVPPTNIGGAIGVEPQDAGVGTPSGGSPDGSANYFDTPDADIFLCPPPVKRCAPANYFTGGLGIDRSGVLSTQADGEASGTPNGKGENIDTAAPQAADPAADTSIAGNQHIGCSVTSSGLGYGQLAFVSLALLVLRRRRR